MVPFLSSFLHPLLLCWVFHHPVLPFLSQRWVNVIPSPKISSALITFTSLLAWKNSSRGTFYSRVQPERHSVFLAVLWPHPCELPPSPLPLAQTPHSSVTSTLFSFLQSSSNWLIAALPLATPRPPCLHLLHAPPGNPGHSSAFLLSRPN